MKSSKMKSASGKNKGKKPLQSDRKYAQPNVATPPISKTNLFLPGDADSLNDDFIDWNARAASYGNNYIYVGKQDNHLVADSIVSSSQGVLVTKIMEFFK